MAEYQFENPYNFVPAPPRDTKHSELGDARPKGHHRYHKDCWSGRISVEMKTVTPLLIPDQGSEASNGHKTFGLRLDADGVPYLPPTSVKGMLRSAYEAVTNSRLGVFEAHDVKLAFRNPARGDVELVPARVSDDGQYFELYPGMGDGSQCAAWVPAYGGAKCWLQHGTPVTKSDHGRMVWATIELWQHYRYDMKKSFWKPDFKFWRVLAYADTQEQLPDVKPNPPKSPPAKTGQKTFSTPVGKPLQKVMGWLCVNNQNMTNKHDERLFFQAPGKAVERIPIPAEIKKQWKTLVTDYRLANKREIDKGNKCPSALKSGEFSRHIREASEKSAKNELASGTLCYLKRNGKQRHTAIYPVIISRELYDRTPRDLLHESLMPADIVDRLSPADRVFGWVSGQEGKGAFKGQLRIGAVRCVDGKNAIEKLGDGVPLTILGQPKPAQSRFYVAENSNGDPLGKVQKNETYKSGQGLRGRKVYPHHRQGMPENYWDWRKQGTEVAGKFGPNDVYREWRHATDKRSDQNRSITAWVKPGTTFRFDIDVVNLSEVELGALLWLLTLPDEHYFRLGGGKPLGFGSVRLRVDQIDLERGEDIKERYVGFDAVRRHRSDDDAVDSLIGRYKKACIECFRKDGSNRSKGQAVDPGEPDDASFSRLPMIAAFLNAAKGGTLPMHYPRNQLAPHPDGKNFEWFVANEKVRGKKLEHGNSLPDLWNDNRGLRVYDNAGAGNKGHGGGRGRPNGQDRGQKGRR